jgi:arginyl-tRNA synthetase
VRTFCPCCPFSDIVEELSEKGVSEVSEGATCVFIPGKEVPLIVQKSDGGFGYASTDMAALKQRVTQEEADWIIYVTDVGQAGHFDLVFAAGRRVGWLPAADSNEVRKWAGCWAGTVRTVYCLTGVPGRHALDSSSQSCRDCTLMDYSNA